MFDIHKSTQNEDDEHDEELAEQYIEGLEEEFAKSPEGEAIRTASGGLAWAAAMMEYAFSYIGCSPPEMTPSDFKEVLFSIIPRKVSVEATEAGAIIAELRAFWNFLARQYKLTNARGIVAVLDDSAATRLAERLSDPSNFGMAKSFFMLGSQAGFDMTTSEGLAEFQAAYNAGARLPAFRVPCDAFSVAR